MSDTEKWFKTPGGRRVREDGSTEIIHPAERPFVIGATTMIATAEIENLHERIASLEAENGRLRAVANAAQIVELKWRQGSTNGWAVMDAINEELGPALDALAPPTTTGDTE